MIDNLNRDNLEDKISVAMCTYNGAEFLEEQLQSIAGQSLIPDELVVFDDQSTDKTVEILKRFSSGAAFTVKIFINKTRMGIIKNFEQALAHCKNDYIALCDQDDLWLPEKLLLSHRAIKEAEVIFGRDKPLLIHSDLIVSDAAGKVIASSFKVENGLCFVKNEPLKNLLVQNFVTGCTVLVNRALLKEALPIPGSVIMHDRWLAMVAAAKGKIISLSDPMVIYRQHHSSAVGSKAIFSIFSLKKFFDITGLEKDIAANINQGFKLKYLLAKEPNSVIPLYMNLFLENAKTNCFRAAFTALRFKIRKYPCSKNIIFLLILAKGGYLKHL